MRIRQFRCIPVVLLALLVPRGAPAQSLTGEQDLTAAYNASGQALFRQFVRKPGNIVISPYSIGNAMAMALSGARGDTEKQMAAVLKLGMPRPAMEDANARALATLNGYDQSAAPPTCPAGMRIDGRMCKGAREANGGCPFPMRFEGGECVGPAKFSPSAKLAVANALMLTMTGSEISPDYVALLKDKYGAEVFRNASLADVNAWVKRKTEGKIDKILEVLDPSAPAVLLNAVYFKAAWLSVFDKRDTRDEAFNLTAANKVQVPMMHRTASYAVLARPGFRVISIPYAVRALSMIVVVPDKIDGVRETAAQLDAGKIAQLVTAVRMAPYKRVELALPRFKAAYSVDLIPPFKVAGMKLAFSDKADFSGMTGRSVEKGGLKIGAIAHRAVIDVEEEGTEAAAATAIVMVPTAAMPQTPEPFRVDRPFLFYIVDEASGAILFQGRISNPR
jgi:leukocyte elastase inhibitor